MSQILHGTYIYTKTYSIVYLKFKFNWVSWFFCLFVWPHSTACGILVPRPGIELWDPAVEARVLNHWTAREVPWASCVFYLLNFAALPVDDI